MTQDLIKGRRRHSRRDPLILIDAPHFHFHPDNCRAAPTRVLGYGVYQLARLRYGGKV